MEYSSAFCSAGWLWRLQWLGFELSIQGQAGWHCKASTLRWVSKVSKKPLWPPATWFSLIISLNSDGCWGQHLQWVLRQTQPGPGGADVPAVKGTPAPRHWWDVLFSGGGCHTMNQRQIVGVCIQPWRDSAAVLIDMVHKMWRVFPSGKYRHSLKQPLKIDSFMDPTPNAFKSLFE